jgi:hypothetical protein
MGPRARLAFAAAAVFLTACFFDGIFGGGGTVPGANYLEPAASVPTCTEFSEFDRGETDQPSRWFQVFMWKDTAGLVRVAEEAYSRLASREGYLGELEFSLDPGVPSQAESLSFYSAIHILAGSRYRDLAEVRSLAILEGNVPLHGLIPPDNASRVGLVAPFHHGTLSLDTAWLIIDGDTGTAASGYGMIFRKNGEAALTYRFLRDSAGVDSLLWVIGETRRPCGQIYYAPEGWSPVPAWGKTST